MKKSLSAALFGFTGLFALLGLFFLLPMMGCGGEAPADPGNVEADPQLWAAPAPAGPIVDSQISWRKFLAEAKQPGRTKLAEEKFSGGLATQKVQIKFMKDEFEYVQFGALKFPNIDPDRLYEVGVVTLAAKESWGANGYQIREYKLRLITPQRNGDWKFVYGTYQISKFQGSMAADPTVLRFLDEKEYQNSYFRHLFVKPLPVAKNGAVTAPTNQGGQQPVETVIKK